MPDLPLILMLASLPLLVFASAFFSGSETALFSLSRQQRREMISGHHRGVTGSALAALLNETRALLVTLLLSNMIVNVTFFIVTTVLLIKLKEWAHGGGNWIALLSVVPLLALILGGEVMPKLFAAQHGVTWTRLCVLPLLMVHRSLALVRGVLTVVVITPLARLIAPRRRPPALTAEELASLLELSQQRGVIDHAEENLLQQVLSLNQLRVRDIMTPRVDIRAHALGRGPAALLQLIRDTGLARVPIYQRDLDDIVGVVFARQVLLQEPASVEQLRRLIRPVLFVPLMAKLDRLLIQFRKQGAIFAIVVDEFGGTAGIITLEDVVEAMVGPIAGSYDHDATPLVQPMPDGSYRVSADLPVPELAAAFGPVGETFGVATAGGLVMARLARLPKPGDRVHIGNLTIEVFSMDGRRIADLILRLNVAPAEPQPVGTGQEGTP